MTTPLSRKMRLRLTALLLSALLVFYSCTTTEPAEGSETEKDIPVTAAAAEETSSSLGLDDASSGTAELQASKLPGLSQKAAPFSRIAPGILADAQKGSPSSIKAAASALPKPADPSCTDDERVLLAMLNAMMNYAYPSERNTVTVPSTLPENTYSGILGSLKEGLYDTNATDTDFFTLTMPSLILVAYPDKDGFYDEAEEALLKACTLNNDSVLVHYLLGVLYTRTGRHEQAAQELQRACSLDPACYETAVASSRACINAGRPDEAVEAASLLLAAYPDRMDVLKLCSEAAFAANDIDGAENYVAQVLQKEPNNMDYILLRAKILFARGEYLKVSSLLDVYQKSGKTSLDYLLLRADLQLKWNKNTSSASATIQNALEQYPDSAEARVFAAELAVETGNTVAGMTAEELIAPVYEQDPLNEQALRIMISGACSRQDWTQAYQLSSVLITLNPSADILIQHVSLCLELNMQNEARLLGSELYAKYPSDEDVQLIYIKVLIASGNRDGARTLIETLLSGAQSKMKSSLYYERSRLQSDENQKLADLRACLTANPRNEDALFALYELYFRRADYRKAQYYLKQVISLNANDERLKTLNSNLDELLSH